MSEAVCALLGAWFTLRAGGYWQGFRVSGHNFGEPVFDLVEQKAWDQVPTDEYVGPAELEQLTCSRCGYVSEAWRPR